ncbi:MAG: hypothetical protein ABII97_02460 [Patescibacteria group bacterium]
MKTKGTIFTIITVIILSLVSSALAGGDAKGGELIRLVLPKSASSMEKFPVLIYIKTELPLEVFWGLLKNVHIEYKNFCFGCPKPRWQKAKVSRAGEQFKIRQGEAEGDLIVETYGQCRVKQWSTFTLIITVEFIDGTITNEVASSIIVK